MIQYNNHNDLCTPVKKHRKKKKILKFYNIKKYQISEQAIEFFFIMRGLNAKEWKEQDIEMVNKYGLRSYNNHRKK